MIQLLENLTPFIRFNKTQDTMIVKCIYKRVNDYDNVNSEIVSYIIIT